MIPKNRRPTHPGEMLKKNYLKPRRVTYRALALATGLSSKHWSNIVNGKARITPVTAMKLAAVFDTTPELWMNAQRNVDFFDAQQELTQWKPKKVFKMKGSVATK
ncbi:HigA family addiction module antidote protein [Candidatus Acetothermia bacterium]|nr:HigA family addiction module antidote protein [Candidatus Acetothermia bacterium]MBI3642702.1 HigA family addiction module antidote protein [Candidatus Acetothermia bacterium]